MGGVRGFQMTGALLFNNGMKLLELPDSLWPAVYWAVRDA